MKFKIVVDSSSNLINSYLNEKDIGFEVVPLILRINNKDYIDNESLDTEFMLKQLIRSKEKDSSSCPSPQLYLDAFEKDDPTYVFCFTIARKLSGSYSNALIAKDMAKNKDRIEVIESKLVAGAIELMIIKTIELIKENKTFEEINKELLVYRDSLQLLFVLDKFDNLIKNGRMNKVVAFIANLANIKPLCYGEDGEIKIKEKIRSIQGALKRLVYNIGKMCESTINRICIISYTGKGTKPVGEKLKQMIEEEYEFKEVKVVENRGLSAFYSLDGGIICCF